MTMGNIAHVQSAVRRPKQPVYPSGANYKS
jgi:hypothetical protein